MFERSRPDPPFRPATLRFPLLAVAISAVLTAGLAATLSEAEAEPGQAGLRRARLNVLYSPSLFRTSNRSDVLAAAKVWLEMVAQRRGFQLDSRLEVSDTLEEIRKRVDEGLADVVIVDSVEYLNLFKPGLIEPFVSIVRGKHGPKQSRLLLVNADSGAVTLEDLRRKSINFSSASDANLGLMWVEVMLHERRLGRAANFFGALTVTAKPSTACLPVYFGAADSCVVESDGWELLKELNPQLGRKLRVIASSPMMIDSILCVHPNFKAFRVEMSRALLELHTDPQGSQILLVFKGNRLVPVTQQDLDEVRDLRAKYLSFASAAGGARGGKP